jgi:CarboxypepD_reg-like domain/Carboxypeptidase regulatory-like domain
MTSMRPPRIPTLLLFLTTIAVVGPGEVQGQSATLSGVVWDSIQGAPLADAAVFLWNTSLRAVSDVEGRFRIEGIPPGEYDVLFFHTRLGEIGASPGPLSVSLGAGAVEEVALGTPSMFTIVSAQCLVEDTRPGSGAIVGRVGDGASGMGMPGASVRLAWGRTDSRGPGQLDLVTNSSGWYRTCAAPARTPIAASASFFDRQSLRREVEVANQGVTQAGFVLSRLPPTHVAGALTDAATEEPVTEATVWLRGTDMRTLTDQHGRFELKEVPPGRYMLMTDHIAYGTKMDTLEVPVGSRIMVDMRLDTRAIEIAPLTVTADALPIPEIARGGIQITRADIDRVRIRARDALDILRAQNIPGVVIRERSDGSICVGYKQGQVRMMFNSGCVPMVIFINDARASNNDMAVQLSPEVVERMVIYKPIEAGNLFGLGAGNGILMIYTRGN